MASSPDVVSLKRKSNAVAVATNTEEGARVSVESTPEPVPIRLFVPVVFSIVKFHVCMFDAERPPIVPSVVMVPVTVSVPCVISILYIVAARVCDAPAKAMQATSHSSFTFIQMYSLGLTQLL
jgi:hypothetical protein